MTLLLCISPLPRSRLITRNSSQLTLKHRDGTFFPLNFLYRPQYQELICSEGIIRLIYCISTIYLPFSDMLFRISINFKQVQDIRDAALDKSNWLDAVTVRWSQQLPVKTGTRSREIFSFLQFTSVRLSLAIVKWSPSDLECKVKHLRVDY